MPLIIYLFGNCLELNTYSVGFVNCWKGLSDLWVVDSRVKERYKGGYDTNMIGPMCNFIYNQDSVESDCILQVITLGLEGQHIHSLLNSDTIGIIIILKTWIKTEK